MKRLLLLTAIFLSGCGPSQEEKRQVEIEQQRIEQEASEQLAKEKAGRVAAVTCSIMGETRKMDSAVRVRELNDAREKIGGEPFLGGDLAIKLSFDYGLCRELVLNDPDYIDKLNKAIALEMIRLEAEQLEQEKLEEAAKIAREKREEAAKTAREKREEAAKIAKAEADKAIIEKFLKGAVLTESGLGYLILKEGSGPKPNIDSTVEVHYSGRLLDGIEFDSSVKRGVPAQFGVTQVISGWTEVLLLMPEGSKWKVYIPAEMAYGSSGSGGVIGPNQDLIFEIELIQSNVE
jgi:FKBP-type peptidyl-prolyl cis-trans isomerase